MGYKKNKDLIEEEVDEFRLLYDNLSGKNHFLNETAGVIWQLLPDQFEEFATYRDLFKNEFMNDPRIEALTLEKDFDDCIDNFLREGLIICV